MVEYKQGDILNAQCEALVNTVNCVGVMGRGVALHFKERFPENFKAYKKACDQGQVLPGKVFVFDTGKMIGPRWILNFPTKRHWRGGSRMEDIAKVDDLVEGFESSEGLELLASVHWVCREEDANSSKRAYELVHSWNKHKEMFTEFQVESALSHLRSLGWLNQAGQVRE